MNKTRVYWLHLLALCLTTILIVVSGGSTTRAESSSPAEMLARAWRNAQETGSYRFISDINQTLVPRPVPEMIGQQETVLNLAIDGAVILPDKAYTEMRVLSGQRTKSVVMLRDGNQSFMLQDGELKPAENALNLSGQSNDMLGYLAGADQVTLLDPPEGHPELVRFGFMVDGPRYAEYVRQLAEAAMRAEPGAPQGLTIQPLPTLQQISGQGELWVNQAGLPVRQVLDLKMPQANEQYGASIHMQIDLSNYGKVASLPQAVQEPGGTWHMEGTLSAAPASSLGEFPGFGQQTAQAANQTPSRTVLTALKARLSSLQPIHVSPNSMIIFVMVIMGVAIVRYYRRNPKRCYAMIVFVLIPIMVLSPVLESAGVVKFMERQVQAAADRAAALPDLLSALGLENISVAQNTSSPSGVASKDSSSSQTNTEPVPLTPQAALELAAANKPEDAPIYDAVIEMTSGQGLTALETCGSGTPGVDTDGDGITDQVEYCLGTVATDPDTDHDGISDKIEIVGFDYAGVHWDSDPLNADSNRDGFPDTREWSKERTSNKGLAVNDDLDGDGIPNLWDDDDDGDGVPDNFDLSPTALTDYTTEFDLSTHGGMSSGTQAIEIELQPLEMDHLRYSTTILDWPLDEEGNVRDLDNSTGDLRLVPFLLVTTNIQPQEELLNQYGIRTWYDEEQGKYILLVTLQPLEDGGAIYAFYAKVAYDFGQTSDIQWSARVVWMAQMQLDKNVCHRDHIYGQVCEIETEPTILHQYQETFRITGLQVTKSESFEAAVMGTPSMPGDDRYLFQLMVGLNNTYQSYQTLEGQDVEKTALGELYSRFTTGDVGVPIFNIPLDMVVMTQPVVYPNAEAGLYDMSANVLPGYFDDYPVYTGGALCRDGDDQPVICASLILSSETHSGVQDLSGLRGTDPLMVALDRLDVNLAEVPVFSVRNTSLRMYERDSVTNAWETMTPARMLEIVEARYQDDYADMLSSLYPNLRVQDARFIAYTGYLWAFGGLLNVISVDGQALVPEIPDENAEALASAVDDALAVSAIDYIGLASNLCTILSNTFSAGQGSFELVQLAIDHAQMSKAAIGGKITLSAFGIAASVASLVMGVLNTICATTDADMCDHETAFLVANILVGTLVISVQTVAIAIQIAEAIIDHLAGTIAKISSAAVIMGFIGAAVGIVMAWVSFGIIAGTTSSSDPVSWRMALGMAIVTTVWLIVLACISLIPIVGPIIAAIINAIDYVLSLLTGLFGNKQWSFAQILFEMWYSAETRTIVESGAFGEFSTSLNNPDLGLIGGNTFKASLPASGVIATVNRGSSDDLELSFIKGDLQPEQDPANPPSNPFVGTAENETPNCPESDGKAYCSNTAAVGYALEPAINGTANFVARMLYQWIWKEYMFWGTVQVNTHYMDGQYPEEDIYNTLYLDVLPATLTGLWDWEEPGFINPDHDGDGLTNEEEVPLGTNPRLWDTDGDGLSDWYEWEIGSERGCDPLDADSDDDGLNDAVERRIGTRISVDDSDGDGLKDGEELRHVENGALVGGWPVTLGSISMGSSTYSPTKSFNVTVSDFELQAEGGSVNFSSDPLSPDDDGDSLNAWEERSNGLSPHARNALVPALSLSVTPIGDIPDARPGAYWLPTTDVSIDIDLANIATVPVTSTLTLTLPAWLDPIDTEGSGVMVGDRQPAMEQDGHTLSWAFTESNTLQLYEAVSTTVTARVNPTFLSASDNITLDMLYGSVQMHKLFRATVDGDDPVVAILSPSNGAYLRGTHFVVGGSTFDRTTWITERSLSIVPSGSGSSFTSLPVGQGAWAFTWDLPTDGIYTLQAEASDAMGHSATTGEVNVTVDNTPPSATLNYEMVQGTVHLSGTALDNLAGVEWIQLMIDGQSWRSIESNGTSWSYNWTVGEGAQGEHTVRVRAIDRSRNQSPIVEATIVVDRVAPASIVNDGADLKIPPAVQPGETFTLTGVADEGGHLPLPSSSADLTTGLDVFDDSTVWLGLSSIHDNDGGVHAAWIGDFNADRLSDLVVGLPGPEGGDGQVVVLYGQAGGWPVQPDLEMLASSPTRFSGAKGERLGNFVAAAGDANADSRDDLLVAGRDSAQAFLVFGNDGPLGNQTLQAGQTGYRTLLVAPANIEGLASAGDVDGDGRADLLITAGGTAYLILGRANPWPETIYVEDEAVASFASVNGALGIGDADNDQRAEWVSLSSGLISVYGWDASSMQAEVVTTVTTADTEPRAVALGDVDGNQSTDWLYSDGASRILVYGIGETHSFTGYDGLLAAPGDVDGDGQADILLGESSGTVALIGQSKGATPNVLATIDGVGGAANAPYSSGADLNADGSAELLLIPNQAAAEERGFDAPDFSSGLVSAQNLPLGASSGVLSEEIATVVSQPWNPRFASPLAMERMDILSASSSETRYVDDDAVNNTCDGHSPCSTTIQAAINLSDGGGDTVIVYPGTYAAFNVPAGASFDHLTVQGVSADAVFIDAGGTGNAIQVAADGVRLSNLTVRNATSGVALQDGAGEPTLAGGEETRIDHLLAHSVQYPINISQSAALSLADSTLVGNGVNPILNVSSTLNSAVHTWHTDRALTSAPALNTGMAGTGGSLYAMLGGTDPTVYTATPGADGALGAWSPAFRVPQEMPYTGDSVKRNIIAAGGGYFYQMHPSNGLPDFGTFNGEVRTVALAPNGDIYAGGSFSMVGTVVANNVARWNGSAWSPLGTGSSNGTDGPVYAVTVTPNGDVYVGGSFGRVFGGSAILAYNIARWSAGQWVVLGTSGELANGTDGPVYALTHTADGVVAVGGHFQKVRHSTTGYYNNRNFALYNLPLWPAASGWYAAPMWMIGDHPTYEPNAAIYSLVWSGGNLYDRYSRFIAGGNFRQAGQYSALNVATLYFGQWYSEYGWEPYGSGINVPVSKVALDRTTGILYAVSEAATSAGLYWFDSDNNTWKTQFGVTGPASALAIDARGNIYVGKTNGDLYVDQPNDSVSFDLLNNEGSPIWDLVLDSLLPNRSGQVLVARGSMASGQGGLRHWELDGLFRRNLSGATWAGLPFPISVGHTELPTAVAVDDAGNLYAADPWSSYSLLYRLSANSSTWELRASLAFKDLDPSHTLTDLVWADGYLYALAHSSQGDWVLYRHDPASPNVDPGAPGPSSNWTQVSQALLPSGAATASSRSVTWDGVDSIYVLQASGAYRYRISTNLWDVLGAPSISFTLSQKPAQALAGSNLYVYATPGTGVTSNLFRYGTVGMPDLRLSVARTAFVEPDAGSSFAWTNLGSSGGTYRFQIDASTDNAWVAPSTATWSPSLPAGANRLTSTQADFMASEDGLYRLGPDSSLAAGYHHYIAVAHVYPSQADCAECGASIVWGQTAFATLREAVESGAARVLVHPGRYPQTFYLVSGVEVIGYGAETTIIEPPASTAGTLVTAEGAAGASLSRVTLAGVAGWNGFQAEGGTTGLELTRTILRNFSTGVTLLGGTQAEIVNNTIVENTNGIVIGDVSDDSTAVVVRNTILAYNTGTGLTHGTNTSSLASTYNDFWSNGTDMNPEIVSLGSLFFDPRFRNLLEDDLRLADNSPLIDMGAPNDPTVPGGGERVDIGYAEYNAAGFYVSKDYSATGLNDGLTWGIDAFNRIQPALDAAATTLLELQRAIPAGGFSVAVAPGTYAEQVSVPSYVRLVGSGAEKTTIDAGAAGSTVTFDGVVASELSGFSLQNASASGAGVEIKDSANHIKITRNIINSGASHGISLVGKSSCSIEFNTIVSNLGAGVYADGTGTWTDVRNNILDSNGVGMQAASGGLIRNAYNLLYNTTNLDGVTAGDYTITADPSFTDRNIYVPSASSLALDAAEPWAAVPLAGGLRADLGYKELIASPLTLFFGPQIDSKITGNSGVARVQMAVVPVTDTTQPVDKTLPSDADWQTLTPSQNDQPLFYWSAELSVAESGLYRVYSKATDQAGNVETDVMGWYEGALVVDGTPPSLTWAAAPPSSTRDAALLAAVNVAGTVSTGSGTRNDVTEVYFNVTQPDGQQKNYPAENGKAWIQLPVANSDTPYVIKAVAIDEAGNSTEISTQVTVTPGASVVTVTSPTSGSAVNTPNISMHGFVRFSAVGSGEIIIGGTGVSPSSPRSVTLASPGEQFSAWSAEFSLLNIDAPKSINITPTQNSTSGTTTSLSINLDRIAPTLTFREPTTTVKQTAAFYGYTSDTNYGSGLARVEVSVDGGYTWRQAAIGCTATCWSLSWDLGIDHDYVSYPVQVRSIDHAGNITTIAAAIAVDNLPPTDLAPVTFNQPVGQHVDLNMLLNTTTNVPIDAGGPVQVQIAVDHQKDVDANTVWTPMAAHTSEVALNQVGDWYVHLVAKDAVGNQTFADYGPWYVRDVALSTPFSSRQESIILDGTIDLAHDEWQATDLLGIDIRSGNPQELYLSADGQSVFLGWSGAWWTLDGVLWAYLDTAPGGTASGVDGAAMPAGLAGSDKAVEIHGPGDGALWTWTGTSWTSTDLDFISGESGDTEVRIPWSPAGEQSLNMLAYALPRAAENIAPVQTQAFTQAKELSFNSGSLQALDLAETGQQGLLIDPWAVFPTTNGLDTSLSQGFTWLPGDLSDPGGINQKQPMARTLYMSVSTPQSTGTAWCGGQEISYDILLENPELAGFTDLTLTLVGAPGLGYQSVSGADLVSGASGGNTWTLDLPALEAGASAHVIVTAQTGTDLSSLTQVASTITLSAGESSLTPESNATATVTHRVDGQAPALNIYALGGPAIAAGGHIFSGNASDTTPDGDGSGVAQVEISLDGGSNWNHTAAGTLGWSILLDTPGVATEFTLQARAVDRCGYTSAVATETFSVDITPPEVTWVAPTTITTVLFDLSGTTSDPAPAGSLVQRVEVQVDDENSAWHVAAGPIGVQGAAQSWTWSWTVPLEDGIGHNLRVRAIDAVGNETTSDPQPVMVDNVAPQLAVNQEMGIPLVVNPQDGSVLTGTATDGSGLQSVSILISGPDGSVSIPEQQATLTDASWTYTPNMTALGVGKYALRVQAVDNHGNLRMQGPYILNVTDEMLEHPEIDLTTLTVFGTTEGDGLEILTGESISWKYTVTNTGNVPLTNVTVMDDHGTPLDPVDDDTVCTIAILAADASQTCTRTGTAAAGLYENTGTAAGTSPRGTNVSDSDGSSYFGADPVIDVENYVGNGTTWQNTDAATGPDLLEGSISFVTEVTNPGNVPLSNVRVEDECSAAPAPDTANQDGINNGDTDMDGLLDMGEKWTYPTTCTWKAGQQTNTATGSGSYKATTVDDSDDTSYFGAEPGFTVSKECQVDSEPIPQAGPAVFTVNFTNNGNTDLLVAADEDLIDGTNIITADTAFMLAAGEIKSFEVSTVGPFTGQAAVLNTINASSAYTDDAGNQWSDALSDSASCRVGSQINLLKLTEGFVDPEKSLTFSIWAGADGFGTGSALASSSTSGDLDGVLDFGHLNLDKNQSYTLCEENVPAGWTSFWQVDSNGDAVIDDTDAILTPYNPNADDPTPANLGNLCVNVGADPDGDGILTSIDLLTDGSMLLFQVDNSYPGGEPRSAGYWKNWNYCTQGGQAENAASNGGWEAGYWMLENVLDPSIGGGITWYGQYAITACEQAVSILDQRDTGTSEKMSSDAAYTLAMHLLAAQLNFAAGAETCAAAADTTLAGEQLLEKISFDGTGGYLRPKGATKADYNYGLELARTLDEYNNGRLCGEPVATDNPPALTITGPADGETLSGTSVTITADASSTSGIAQVEFFVDGVSIGVDLDGSDTWSAVWDLAGVADAVYTLSATVTASDGQTGSHSITVTVDNQLDPLIKVASLIGSSAPANKNTWQASVIVSVDPALAGAVVSGSWSNGSAFSCTTDASGKCTLMLNLNNKTASVTLTVSSVALAGYGYDPSGVTAVTVNKP